MLDYGYYWNGMIQGDMKNKERKIHPTQKPKALYKWLLRSFAEEGDKILDTHVGSASSLCACNELGFNYVGFELSSRYYELSKARLDEIKKQVSIMELMNDWKLP